MSQARTCPPPESHSDHLDVKINLSRSSYAFTLDLSCELRSKLRTRSSRVVSHSQAERCGRYMSSTEALGSWDNAQGQAHELRVCLRQIHGSLVVRIKETPPYKHFLLPSFAGHTTSEYQLSGMSSQYHCPSFLSTLTLHSERVQNSCNRYVMSMCNSLHILR